jgi:cell division septation protein DedD
MKIHSKPIPLILLTFLLAACGANTAQEEAALSDIYTAAAATVGAQASSAVPTAIRTIAATATPITFPTTTPMTVTSQSADSYSSQSTANGCNDAVYVSDVTIPDGTVLAPSEAFVKTWKFQNTGTCTWDEDYLLTFVSGTDMDGETTEIDQEVSSGATGEISVSLIAPSSEGSYTGYWRLADESGNAFGQSVYVMIVVSDDASTLTPTPTSTTEAVESTPTSTSTPPATETSTPTSIPTATPTETSEPSPTASESAE